MKGTEKGINRDFKGGKIGIILSKGKKARNMVALWLHINADCVMKLRQKKPKRPTHYAH